MRSAGRWPATLKQVSVWNTAARQCTLALCAPQRALDQLTPRNGHISPTQIEFFLVRYSRILFSDTFMSTVIVNERVYIPVCVCVCVCTTLNSIMIISLLHYLHDPSGLRSFNSLPDCLQYASFRRYSLSKSRCRRIKPPENRQFWPHVLGDRPPKFTRPFSNLAHFRICGDVQLNSVCWPPKLPFEKKERRKIYFLWSESIGSLN